MKDVNSEKTRERILELIESEFSSDVAFEKEMSLPPKTVNNWRRGLSGSYMKILPKLSERFKVSVGELLDMPIIGDKSDLSEDEKKLLTVYRKSRTLTPKTRQYLFETLEATVNLYVKANQEMKEKKKRSKIREKTE